MFKRVTRRQKRKEEEEDLGLTEEMKEVMGMQDTDSSESDSNSDDDSDSDSEGSGEDEKVPKFKGQKRKRGAEDEEELGPELEEGTEGDDGELDGEVEEDDGEKEEQEEEEQEGESDEDEEPTMSISAALQNPLHVVSLDPEIRTCVVCPGKLLKNAKMIEVHMASNVCLPLSSFCSSLRSFPFTSCLYIPAITETAY